MTEKLLLIIGILELIVRIIPTSNNWSIIDLLHNIVSRLIPNKVLGDENRPEVWTSIRRTTKVSKDILS